MKRLKISLALAAVIASSQPVAAQRAENFSPRVRAYVTADEPVVLVRDVRVVDVEARRVRTGQSILVRDGRIAAIDPRLEGPPGARIVDGRGRTALPGLVLVHEHLMVRLPIGEEEVEVGNPYVAQVMLAYGVTTARTAGSFDLDRDLAIGRGIARGQLAGPDLDVSMFVGGAERPMGTIPRLKDEAGARRDVAYWADRGATSIKLWFGTDPAAARGAIAEAKSRGMNVAGHLCAIHARTAAALGLETLEHGLWSGYDLLPGAAEGTCPMLERQVGMFKRLAALSPDAPEVTALLRDLKDRGIAITPTLSVLAAEPLCGAGARAEQRELSLLTRPERQGRSLGCMPGLARADIDGTARFQAETAVRLFRMGGTLLVGTDQGKVPGAGAPDELEALASAGIPAMDVLAMATINGARALRRDAEVGSLKVGKRADFVLVEGRPDRDIKAMRNVTAVFRDGIGYDPDRLRDGAKGTIIN